MAKKVPKTLFYRRAKWVTQYRDLERLLRTAHQRRLSTAERTFQRHDGEMTCLKAGGTRSEGLFLHVAYYVPKQPVSILPVPSKSDRETDTDVQAPPPASNFVDGDIFIMVRNNNVLLCASRVREQVAEAYMKDILAAVGMDDEAGDFEVEPIADVNTLALIQREGVKKIELAASAYEASVDHMKRHTAQKSLTGRVADGLVDYFRRDEESNLSKINERENLTIRVTISYDARRVGGEVGAERMVDIARRAVRDPDAEGFSIVTMTGTTIRPDQVRISKQVRMEPKGNTVFCREAWAHLLAYHRELKRTGKLEQ